MKKLLLSAFAVAAFTASAAEHKSPSLINGNAIVVSNNTTVYWYTTNALYALDQLASSSTTTPFPTFDGTNAPTTNFLAGLPLPAYNLAYAYSSNVVTWSATNYGTGTSGNLLYSNIWRTDLTNNYLNAGWGRIVNPVADANSDAGLGVFTFGLVGSAANSSNTVAITLEAAKYGTNFVSLGTECFTITVTNGQQTTGAPTPLVPTFWATNLPSTFLQCTKSIRIQKIVVSSIGSSGYITVFDARVPQWYP